MRDPLSLFDDVASPSDSQPATYPGSKQVRRAVAGPSDPWENVPSVTLTYRGESIRFYPVGVLADALGRKTPAIRKWERLGYLPPTPFRSPGRSAAGQKRLYTRAQIEGLVAIAREEGVTGDLNRNVSATAFPARAAALFKELG